MNEMKDIPNGNEGEHPNHAYVVGYSSSYLYMTAILRYSVGIAGERVDWSE